MTENTPTTATPDNQIKTIREIINWEAIDQRIQGKTAKLASLSKELAIPQEEFKKLLIEHYGDQIVFKRGRYGGIYYKE